MDVMKMEIIEKKMQGFQIIKKESTTDAAGSSRSSSTAEKVTTMVGLDEVLYEMLDTITGGECVRKIIPIVGMGGLGKTTLARNIYAHQLVKEHFDICAWSTISQVHNAQKILKEILGQVGLDNGGDLSEGDLGVKLYKHLIGKRYLIVMDDIWSIEAWDKVRSFFPENENGSRVVVTTRLSNLASKFNYSDSLDMKFLDKASSWNLFQRTVFGEGICPLDMKDIGKKIVEGCRGLPLSIVVVGGLLSKSEATRENWEVVEENLTSVVNAEDEGSCLQILYMSYNNLPVHLKPCFLYMGVFPEDDEIEVLTLIPKWVAEGFIKPVDRKSLEEAEEEYLEELVERNLVMVEKRNYYGKLKYCKVHDLLRDLALREGENHRFLYWLKQSSGDRDNSQGTLSTQRRIATTSDPQEYTSSTLLIESVEGAGASSLVRSLIGNFPEETLSLPSFRLLRVCMIETLSDGAEESSDECSEEESSDEYYEEVFNRLLNLRFLLVNAKEHPLPRILSSSVFSLWNLQTLILKGDDEVLVLEIWKMPLLRHVITNLWAFCLPDPPPLGGDEVVMENLHTLSEVRNLNLSEEVFTRIPNIRILKLFYEEESESESESEEEGDEEGESEEDEDEDEVEDEENEDEEDEEEEEEEEDEEGDYYSLNNLHRLNKLQELSLIRYGWSSRSMRQLILPHSIKQLTLEGSKLPWEEMASKIGWLPLLQVLILKERSFIGSEWETVEGQFSSLKFLKIEECRLECWTTDNTHFPRLEHLQLRLLKRLREVPSSIGDVPTLRSIELDECSDSAVESARTIVDEQEELGNQDIKLQVFY